MPTLQICYIADLSDPKYLLSTEEDDARAIKEHLGTEEAQEYDSFFVEILDGEYGEIWGFYGIIPTLDKTAYRLQ